MSPSSRFTHDEIWSCKSWNLLPHKLMHSRTYNFFSGYCCCISKLQCRLVPSIYNEVNRFLRWKWAYSFLGIMYSLQIFEFWCSDQIIGPCYLIRSAGKFGCLHLVIWFLVYGWWTWAAPVDQHDDVLCQVRGDHRWKYRGGMWWVLPFKWQYSCTVILTIDNEV